MALGKDLEKPAPLAAMPNPASQMAMDENANRSLSDCFLLMRREPQSVAKTGAPFRAVFQALSSLPPKAWPLAALGAYEPVEAFKSPGPAGSAAGAPSGSSARPWAGELVGSSAGSKETSRNQ